MIITQEWVDSICPRHGRTSCSDDNLSNAYGGWTGYYRKDTGGKEIDFPRCNRCYLLKHIGDDTDDIEFAVQHDIYLVYKGDKE